MKLAIITPSFNQGEFIESTIQSVITQSIVTQKECEFDYLIVDGGSTDHTLTILQKYQHQLRFISERDEGQSDAVNKGIEQTDGDVIGWLNSDDIYYPDTLKKVVHFFQHHPDVDVVYGKANNIDPVGNVLNPYLTEEWNFERLKIHCFISQPATFFRRRVVNKIGLLNRQLTFCMDYHYWIRLALHGASFAYLPEILAGSRIHAQTKSTKNYVAAHREALSMLHETLHKIPIDWLLNYSSAKAKTELHLTYPHPKVILKTWMNLWETSGFHHRGGARIKIWIQAQVKMMMKMVGRILWI